MNPWLLIGVSILIVGVIVVLKPDILSGLFGGFGLGSTTQTVVVKKGESVTGSTRRVSTDIMDYVSSNDRRSKGKGVLFLLFPLFAFCVLPYPTTYIVATLGFPVCILIWVALGISSYFLVPYAAFEDDAGRKMLNLLYKGVVFFVLVTLLVSMFAPSEYDYSKYLQDNHPEYTATADSILWKFKR